jgi:hypothetical protein
MKSSEFVLDSNSANGEVERTERDKMRGRGEERRGTPLIKRITESLMINTYTRLRGRKRGREQEMRGR